MQFPGQYIHISVRKLMRIKLGRPELVTSGTSILVFHPRTECGDHSRQLGFLFSLAWLGIQPVCSMIIEPSTLLYPNNDQGHLCWLGYIVDLITGALSKEFRVLFFSE